MFHTVNSVFSSFFFGFIPCFILLPGLREIIQLTCNKNLKDMAQATETIITDREISRLADLFPGYEYFKIADYFDTDRVTAMNINYNAR